VLNPLNFNGGASASSGNLNFGSSTSDIVSRMTGTIAVTSGKWYFEATRTDAEGIGNQLGLGVTNTDTALGTGTYSGNPTSSGASANEWVLTDRGIACNTSTYTNLSGTIGTIDQNDVVQICIDMDAKKIWFGIANTFSGSPSAGTGEAFSNLPSSVTPLGYNYNGVFAFNFGQRPFAYTPPTGFVALNTFNLPTPTIGATASTQANKYFDALTYTGTGATNAITSLNFSPDFAWFKNRSTAENHALFDIIRGANKNLASNTTSAEGNQTDMLMSFDSNGYTLGSDGNWQVNRSGASYVSWNWDAGSSTVTNTSGSISAQVRANTTSGFSVVTYTGTGSNATVGHGLGVALKMLIVKNRVQGTYGNWNVWQSALTGSQYLTLNDTSGASTNNNRWNGTVPTSTVFSLGADSFGNTNKSGDTYVAYCFSEVAGYSKFGTYTGNGSTNGPFVYLGFRPRYVMVKSSSNTENWFVWDSARNTYNVVDLKLYPNLSNAENGASGETSTTNMIDFVSNGFKLRTSNSGTNASGYTYIYAAFAESPFNYANAR
jgi:hypothetical protein